MPPAARVLDKHLCPQVTGTVPHVGGLIMPPGSPTVTIGGQPAARVGDRAMCTGALDAIILGSPTVTIDGLFAARMFDKTAHGGFIDEGCPTVIIG
jgi:uncharacterized Zn-binding protein involved in type VI secretion